MTAAFGITWRRSAEVARIFETADQHKMFLFAVAVALVSAGLTRLVTKYAVANSIVDRPNHRSSHTVPTPRGGGAAIVLTFVCGLIVLTVVGTVSLSNGMALAGVVFISASGWLDDKRGLSAAIRAMIQALSALWALYWLGGMKSVDLLGRTIELGMLGDVLFVLGVMWSTNLFNFMDGIDGIAGVEGVSISAGLGALAWLAGNSEVATLSLLIGSSTAGFLYWNWSPAKVFMGDVGSGSLGFLFAILAVAASKSGTVPLMSSFMLGGVFVIDASVTLVRRVAQKARWSEAHRTHAYQRLVSAGFTHRLVAGAVAGINVLICTGLILSRSDPGATALVWSGGTALILLMYGLVERISPMRRCHATPEEKRVTSK